MKKITFLLLLLSLELVVVAQNIIQPTFLQPITKFKPVQGSKQFVPSRAVNDTIWSDDFSSPSNWTMSHTGGTGDWEIQTTFSATAGCGTGTVSSSSFQNGFAIYDACQYGDTLGEDAFITYNGTIDCSAYSNVSIRFQQRFKKYTGSQSIVEVSTDGTTWDSYEVNLGVTPGIFINNVVLNISNTAANQPLVYIRFHFYGVKMYAWSIDDIAIVEGGNYDMAGIDFQPQFVQNGTPVGWFCEMPYTNVLPLAYRMAVAKNVGMQPLTGPLLLTEITENGTTVFTNTVNYPTDTIFPSGRDTLLDTVAFYPATTPNHTYTVNMTINENETDQDFSTNVMIPSKTFSVTDDVIRRTCTHNCWISPSNFGYSGYVFIGATFFLPQTDTVFYLDCTVLADSGALASGASMVGVIYEDDGIGNWVEVIQSDPYDITPSDTVTGGHQVNLQLLLDGFTEILQGANAYAAGIEFIYDTASAWVGIAGNDNPNQNFQTSNLVQSGGNWYYSSCVPDIGVHFDSLPHFDTLPQVVVDTCILFNYTQVYVESYSWIDPTHVEVVWAFVGSGQIAHIAVVYEVLTPGNYVLSIVVQCGTKSMHIYYDNVYINQYVGIDEANQILVQPLQIYPNPAKDNVTLLFKQVTGNAVVTIFDDLGQLVSKEKIVTTGHLNMDVQKLKQGIYFIRVETGNTVYSGRFSKGEF